MKILRNLTLISGVILFYACVYASDLVPMTKQVARKYSVETLRNLIDTNLNDSVYLADLINFKSIDNQGNVSTVSGNQAFNQYEALRKKNQCDSFPIFEIKNTNNVIVVLKGKGLWGPIWGTLLIEKPTRKILKVEFGHASETPGLGAKIVEKRFKDQYINQIIQFDSEQQKYAIIQSDNSASKIDAIAGATITSKGVFMMMNSELNVYSKYFQK